jgi:ribonuclease VapC
LIVVDTSALIAILIEEEDHWIYQSAIDRSFEVVIAAPTKFEFMMVATGKLKAGGIAAANDLLMAQGIRVRDWTSDLADIAASAFMRYGKGLDKAALNFGDCMAYALAKSLDAPLLYKGDDFARTDIRNALA